MFHASDIQAILLTAKLAAVSTLLLLLICTPLAWWLARSVSWQRSLVSTLVAMPLVLPPTVLGFYLLLLMSPSGPVGQVMSSLGLEALPFTFTGLVVASVIYSLPFVVQPLQASMAGVSNGTLEAAATLGAGPLDRFFSIVVPQCWRGFFAACALGFAHTVGEFGVVLMIGGNIPGETRVLSIHLYDMVEALQYDRAHTVAAALMFFSFLILLPVYGLHGWSPLRRMVPRPASRERS